jgi:hypothetical protein
MNEPTNNLSKREQIRSRIERFAFNYHGNGQNVNIRHYDGEDTYWVGILGKDFTKEFAFVNYDSNLSLRFYFANNKQQGNHYYNGTYGMRILKTKAFEIDGQFLGLRVFPTFKISNPWGKHIFDVRIHSFDHTTLIQLFHEFAGRRSTADNVELIASLKKYPGIIDVEEFNDKYTHSFLNVDEPHNFFISLSIGIWVAFPLDLIREIELKSQDGNDGLVDFVKKIEQEIINRA